MPCERAKMCAIACVPQTDGEVTTATCDCVAIRTERYTPDTSRMHCDRAEMCAVICVPQMDGAVTTATCDCVAIRTESNAVVINRARFESAFIVGSFRFCAVTHFHYRLLDPILLGLRVDIKTHENTDV